MICSGIIIGLPQTKNFTLLNNKYSPQSAAGDWISLNGDAEVDGFFAGNGTTGASWQTAYLFQNQVVNLSGYNYGFHIGQSSRYIIFQNCTFYGILTSGSQDAAIRAYSCSNIKIQNCTFQDNVGAGICLNTATNCYIDNNTFMKNGYGIQTDSGCANSYFRQNVIWNSSAYAIFLQGNAVTQLINNMITENDMRYNSFGIFFDIYCQRNTVSFNIVANSTNTGIRVNGNYGTNSILYNAIWGSNNDIIVGGTDFFQIVEGNAIGTQADSDGDGLTDFAEVTIWNTNRLTSDTDNDNLLDAFEIKIGTDPLDDDSDDDGYYDGIEIQFGSDPLDPNDNPSNESTISGYPLMLISISLGIIIIIIKK